MLDIKFIRENPAAVKENIRKKFQNAKLPLVDEVIALDAEKRAAENEGNDLRAQRNKLSKQVGMLMGQAKKDPSKLEEDEAVKAQVKADADRLAQLEEMEEPVVLVFFGDHLPYLGDNQLAYAELGFTARPEWDALTSYETPYVIWANDAAAQALDWEAAVASLDLPEDGRLSASFLGAAVLELTGRTGESPWFDFLNQLRRELPVVQKQAYQVADGTVTDQLTEEQAAKIAKWRQWSYYKLMYKEID